MLSHWLISVLLVGLRLISGFRFGMVAVEEFDNVEPAFVDIEMYVPCFKVGRACFPDKRFWIQPLDFPPRCTADSFTVNFRIDKQ